MRQMGKGGEEKDMDEAKREEGAEEGGEPPRDPQLDLAEKLFLLRKPAALEACKGRVERAVLEREAMERMEQDNMAPIYAQVCEELGWVADEGKLKAMREALEKGEKEADERIEEAESKQGDLEVSNEMLSKARLLGRAGDKRRAFQQYDLTRERTVGMSQRMEQVLEKMRLALAFRDLGAAREEADRLKGMLDSPGGGDWERRNRLKVYEGALCLLSRDFSRASKLFLESLSTFNATELFSYERFIFYAIIASVVSCSRTELKRRVTDAPEVLQVVGSLPPLEPLLNSLHECQYARFLRCFVEACELCRADFFLHDHVRFFMREVRAKAYAQFLESYRSVTLSNMAAAFGVSTGFLDAELASFIASGRLNARIDKTSGVVATTRPDAKNAHYQQALKQGDVLLNRVQKLSRVIDL